MKMKNIIETTKKNEGITMVALIIMIIVLIILASVSIGVLTDEDGIIKEAQKAKKGAELVSIEEQIDLAILKAEEKYRNPTLEQVIEEIKKNEVIQDNDQVNPETGTITTNEGYVIEGKLGDYLEK